MEAVTAREVELGRGTWPAKSFLARAGESMINALLAAGALMRIAPRSIFIREGDRADRSIYLLISGFVKVTSTLEKGPGYALLAVRAGGDLVGELSALDGQQRSASVQVCGTVPAVACRLEGPAFVRVLEEHSEMSLVLTTSISAKLRTAIRRRIDVAVHDPDVRMARVLVELAEDYGRATGAGVTIGIDLTHLELGTAIGTSRATAYRALRALRDVHLVSTQPELIIRDIAALRAYARLSTTDVIK